MRNDAGAATLVSTISPPTLRTFTQCSSWQC